MSVILTFPDRASLTNYLNTSIQVLNDSVRDLIQEKCLAVFFARIFGNKTCSETEFNTYMQLAITELTTTGTLSTVPTLHDPEAKKIHSTSDLVRKIFPEILLRSCFKKPPKKRLTKK